MKKTKIIQTLLAVFILSGTFLIFQKKMGNNIVYGYGYNSSVVSVDPLETSVRSPQITGSYTGGPYIQIYVSIYDQQDVLKAYGEATDNDDGTWTLPAGTFAALPIGTYNVYARVTDELNDTTYDGTDNELKITADFLQTGIDIDLDGSKVTIEFKNSTDAAQYMVSRRSDFKSAEWKTIADHVDIKLGSSAGKRTYYVKFKDLTGKESKTFKDSVSYTPKRYIKNSKSSIKQGETLTQSGKKFSKNSEVELYFSNSKGGYYPPQKVTTDSRGGFKLEYMVKKPAGKYKWYAVDVKTGKKTKAIYYKVK